jgi:hypothetical protein
MLKRLRLFGVVALVTGGLLIGAALALAGPGGAVERARRLVYVGGPLLVQLQRLPPGELTAGSVEILIGFAPGNRVAADTFRCLLNGRDVTGELTLGRNGAVGTLRGLTEGPNRIRLEIFGRSWWADRFVEDHSELLVPVAGRPAIDRA